MATGDNENKPVFLNQAKRNRRILKIRDLFSLTLNEFDLAKRDANSKSDIWSLLPMMSLLITALVVYLAQIIQSDARLAVWIILLNIPCVFISMFRTITYFHESIKHKETIKKIECSIQEIREERFNTEIAETLETMRKSISHYYQKLHPNAGKEIDKASLYYRLCAPITEEWLNH